MRKHIMSIVAVVALGMATPVMAYDSGGLISMQAAWVLQPILVS
ncbi:MAG: hypothetical protein QOE39_3090 [Bradyrhizobium sp.]|jgi:hypothetical protein|nr:hypothetical protein [Bradyrhizobium sp.]